MEKINSKLAIAILSIVVIMLLSSFVAVAASGSSQHYNPFSIVKEIFVKLFGGFGGSETGPTGAAVAGGAGGGDSVTDCWNDFANPHPICSCNDLNRTRTHPDFDYDWNGTDFVWGNFWSFELQNDIDFSLCDSSYTTGQGFEPIGTGDYLTSFKGMFNGNGHTIKNLYINRPLDDGVGLFGSVYNPWGGSGSPATNIRNINLIDVNITGHNYVGGLVGRTWRSSVEGAFVKGRINGTGYSVGGVAGVVYGNTTNSRADVIVYGGDAVGGLVGDAQQLFGITGNANSLINCNSSGKVIITVYAGAYSNGNYAGGLAGFSDGIVDHCHSSSEVIIKVDDHYGSGGLIGRSDWFNITNSYATGNVAGINDVGGLIGTNNREIYNSYATGNVTGKDYVGGLVGDHGVFGGTIINSYSTGDVNGSSFVGGLVGLDSYDSTGISDSFATGKVTGLSNYGGLVGLHYGLSQTVNSYWDVCRTGQTQSAKGIAKNNCTDPDTNYFYSTNPPIDNWDFSTVWTSCVNGYPILQGLSGQTCSAKTDLCLIPDSDSDSIGDTCDCNDANMLVYPGSANTWCDCNTGNGGGASDGSASELCDGFDNNCNGIIDEGASCLCTYGQTSEPVNHTCGMQGVCSIAIADCGTDGLWNISTCRDFSGPYEPNKELSCTDGYDNDCDGNTDSADPDCCQGADNDNDYYSTNAADAGKQCCVGRTQTCLTGADCNDGNAQVHPGALEICNGIDDDCNGLADSMDGLICGCLPGEINFGCMGAGVCAGSYRSCDTTNPQETFFSPCNYPPSYQSTELSCTDGNDNDCDGLTDYADPDCCQGADNDNDFYSTNAADAGKQCCIGKTANCSTGIDCNDNNATIHPGATETCNNIDDDCNTQIDDGLEPDSCSFTCVNAGKTWTGALCCGDDANEDSPYEANEISCTDGNDNDCDGLTDYADPDCCQGADNDNDFYSTNAADAGKQCCIGKTANCSTGIDCNDNDATMNPASIFDCGYCNGTSGNIEYSTSATVCRASAGACDLAETCTGFSLNCPADAKSTAVCRASAGICDVAESCDGITNACPTDEFSNSSTQCDTWNEYGCPWGTDYQSNIGINEREQYCTGSSADCSGTITNSWTTYQNCGTCYHCDITGSDQKNTNYASCLASPTSQQCNPHYECAQTGGDNEYVPNPESPVYQYNTEGYCDGSGSCDYASGTQCSGIEPSWCRPGVTGCNNYCYANGGIGDDDMDGLTDDCDADCCINCDADSDGIADQCDTDDDNDGVPDTLDCNDKNSSIGSCGGVGSNTICSEDPTSDVSAGTCVSCDFSCKVVSNGGYGPFYCDGTNWQTGTGAGYVCRASQGNCDIEEKCEGTGSPCPADIKLNGVCRPSAGVCDTAESCDGINNNCPTDEFKASSIQCDTWNEYGCPWGTDYQSNIGINERKQYCTSSSADCSGTITNSWTTYQNCGTCYHCDITGSDQKNTNYASCLASPTSQQCDPYYGCATSSGDNKYTTSQESPTYQYNTQGYCDGAGSCDNAASGTQCAGRENNWCRPIEAGCKNYCTALGNDDDQDGRTDECDADCGGLDTDGDGTTDVCDTDDDNDGILDTSDCNDKNSSIGSCGGIGSSTICSEDPTSDVSAGTCVTCSSECDVLVNGGYGPFYCDGTNWQTGTGTNHVCDTGLNPTYSCDDGTAPGDNVFYYTQKRYCGGAGLCDGTLEDETHTLADDCSACEECISGQPTCSPIDADNDGYDICTENDCNDNSAAVHPGATETCNGVDDDCNSGTADGSGESWYGQATSCGVGECASTGNYICQAGSQVNTCVSGTPQPEICDGLDDNCNGLTDANDSSLGLGLCELQDGVCSGTYHLSSQCVNGAWQQCTAAEYGPSFNETELCPDNGVDNNCDGNAVFNCNSTCDVDGDGYKPIGAPWYCLFYFAGDCDDGNALVHPGAAEVCNGVDDDCNSGTTDGLDEPWYGQATSCGVGGCESAGNYICQAGSQFNTCVPGTPQMEICDHGDNDCNGAIDNGLICNCYQGDQTNCANQLGVCLGSKDTCMINMTTGEGNFFGCTDATYLSWSPYYETPTETTLDRLGTGDDRDNNCDGYIDGNDLDRDIIEDFTDNCNPSIYCNINYPACFNPDQSNLDSENGGDVCDICPTMAGATCTNPPLYSAGESIGSDGGNLTNNRSEVTISVPPGTLPGETSVTMSKGQSNFVLQSVTGRIVLVLYSYELTAANQTSFNPPLTLTFYWGDFSLTPTQIANLNVWYKDANGTLQYADINGKTGVIIDNNTKTITAHVSHFTQFMLGIEEGKALKDSAIEILDGAIAKKCQGDSDGDGILDPCDSCNSTKVSKTPTKAWLNDGTIVTSKVEKSDNKYASQSVTNSDVFIYLNWQNTLGNVPDSRAVEKAILTLEHNEYKADMSVEIYNGTWKSICNPKDIDKDTVDTCDVSKYIKTAKDAKNISIRLRIKKTGACHEDLDLARLDITYCMPKPTEPSCGEKQLSKSECDKLKEARDYVADSLKQSYWVNTSRLSWKDGGNVFIKEAKAVKECLNIKNKVSDCSAVISLLTGIDGDLAETALEDAKNLKKENPKKKCYGKKIELAQKFIDKANSIKNTKPVDAIIYYKVSWELSQEAMKCATWSNYKDAGENEKNIEKECWSDIKGI
jgi:hypothetical protein